MGGSNDYDVESSEYIDVENISKKLNFFSEKLNEKVIDTLKCNFEQVSELNFGWINF